MDDERVIHATEHPDLKRAIGPWLLFFFVLGDIVGAGIYALVGEVGAVVGGAIWAAFLFSFILAIFTAGGRGRHLRQQRLQNTLPELHGGLRGDGRRDHFGLYPHPRFQR